MTEGFPCTHCGTVLPLTELHTLKDALYCRDCLAELTAVCDHCGHRFRTGELHQEQDLTLCYSCLDDCAHCHGCGRLVPEDELHYLSDSSDEGGERGDRACRLIDIANSSGCEHIYIKHDGSLENGMEIVTHPMSLAYHLTEMPWADVVAEAIHMGYRSHKSCTCGLHVHVNRSAFGDTEEEQEEVIARILFFVENHRNKLLRFSRRSRSQMVDRICEVALYLTDDEMKLLTWTNFVVGCTAPELVQYLKERRLYVNDPVDVPEEV